MKTTPAPENGDPRQKRSPRTSTRFGGAITKRFLKTTEKKVEIRFFPEGNRSTPIKIHFVHLRPPTADRADAQPNSKYTGGLLCNVHFSSRTDDWSTPQWLFDSIDQEFHFTLDPCATDRNAKCQKFFTRAQNGLLQDWRTHVVFMNPPYGREIGLWMKKACDASQAGATVVALIPARPDTNWWHTFVAGRASEIRFLKGRIKFGGGQNSAPFPSAIIVYRPTTQHTNSSENLA
jgi:site-specific DNA-methyltransferase (adenine-specific)